MSRQIEDVMAVAERRLSGVNQRLTSGRRALLAILAKTDRPLTLPEVLDADSSLAQSSAYRNLVVLEEAGVVERVVTRDEFARYELTEDITGHHHHLVCSGCGRVEDLAATASLEEALKSAITAVQRRRGFRVDDHRLDLIGMCADCA